MNQQKTAGAYRAVNVRVPSDVMARLDRIKADKGLSYSAVIVTALRDQLDLKSPVDSIRKTR